ncbi:dynactin subunit 5 [Thecamonas trahens ATCC 50062]|uniref:Dynactin subunit 5 n=1 Tax=Thecamonas trahens ATCC 50062 TaxID=461836 RepID=A0A0L0DIQ2_THETB|nr:dynactin subunit 5 [Thecamonas trahens ATCC 50062]KNC52070.1 dynactin subunit 5 [Thecamonas trahens ATCC 50062]|eukprot:XP_013762075.1 dynactin subunit 5 [Thecamonas trahens ATCC 50062]
MEVVEYNPEEWIETASGNKVSRASVLCGSQNIILNGKSLVLPGSIIRGDLAAVRIGRYCVISDRVVLRPAYKALPKGLNYFQLSLGDCVYVGKDAVVEAASIGSHVIIGEGAIVSKRAVILDCCEILPGAVVPEDAVIPPFSIYGGNPAVLIGELTEAAQRVHEEKAFACYESYVPAKAAGV